MKTMKIVFVSFVFVALAASQAAAQVTFRAPMGFAGTGCPAGSINVAGENTSTLSILFDSYDAGQGMNSVSGMPRTSCNFSIPVRVPAGYQVSLITADWRGYAQGGVQLAREYFIAGQRGPSKRTQPSRDYMERDEMAMISWSPCSKQAQEITMRVNSSIRAMSRPSYIAVDSVDVNGQRLNVPIIFNLQAQRCR
jgi:hypothetical protein